MEQVKVTMEFKNNHMDEVEGISSLRQTKNLSDIVVMLYDNLNINILASVSAATILFSFAWLNQPNIDQVIWLFCIFTISGIRLIEKIFFNRSTSKQSNPEPWYKIYLISLFIAGCVWGMGGVYFSNTVSPTYPIIILFVFGGLVSASVVSQASVSFPAFLSFAIPLTAPIVISLFLKGEREFITLALLTLVYLFMIFPYAWKLNKSVKKMFSLEDENYQLILKLEKEKTEIEKLNNNLEERVVERTSELEESNQRLQEEFFRSEKIEHDLNEKKALFKNTFEYAPIGMGLGNLEGYTLEVNKTLCDIVGFTQEELIGKNFREFLHPDEVDKTMDLHMQLLTGESDSYNAEKRYKHKQGGYVWVKTIVSVVNDIKGSPSYFMAQIEDISKSRKLNEKLMHQANHDSLTGLTNRYAFELRLKELIDESKSGQSSHVLCYLDLDQFKLINDTCGHDAGDALLQNLSDILKSSSSDFDGIARLGGDEFGLLIEDCSLEMASILIEKIREEIEEYQFIWKGSVLKVSASIGLVSVKDICSVTELLKAADTACYAAKDTGRNRIHIFNTDDDYLKKRMGEMEWVTKTHKAFQENRFFLVKQLIKSSSSDKNETKGKAELLLRMEDVNGETILPGKFLPAAERYNIAMQIDEWVIETVFQALYENEELFSEVSMYSINLSGQSIGDNTFFNFVERMIGEYPGVILKICFEITETAVINNFSNALSFIHNLKAKGCHFALDDFGSGLSSYAYLKTLPVDYIKIDGMFVRDIVEDQTDFAMVKSINEIAHMMQKKTIAEFVESDEILKKIEGMGVDFVQGYAVGKPVPFGKSRRLKIVSNEPSKTA